MNGTPDTHEEILNAHVSDGETINAVHSDGVESLAITDTRLLHIVTGDEGERQAYKTDMIPLDSIASVRTDLIGEEPVDMLSLAAGGISVAVTIGFFWASTQETGPLSTFLLFGALGGAVGALTAFAKAFDTDDSKVKIEVQPTAGDDRMYKLPKNGVDLATEITEQAG